MILNKITVRDFFQKIEEPKRGALKKLRNVIKKNIDCGFEERIDDKYIHYTVPLKLYPEGYLGNPKHPLPFISITAQKNNLVLHHLGLYASPSFLVWLTEEYPKHAKYRLDMGKGRIKFKKLDDIPYELIAELTSKISLIEWIKIYEREVKPNKRKR